MNTPAATIEDWKTKPFGPCTDIPYQASFTFEEGARLKKGLIPESMEDKWFIYFQNGTLYFHRSWIGLGVFKCELLETETGYDIQSAVIDKALLNSNDPAPQAAILGWLISNLLLGQNLPYPDYFSGTGH